MDSFVTRQPRATSCKTRLKFVSWNVDGLDSSPDLTERAAAAAKVLVNLRPDVIFLQELTAENLGLFEDALACAGFAGICERSGQPYFAGMFLNMERVVVQQCTTLDFPTSQMGRHLISVKASIDGVPVTLMTSHLESCASSAEERERQLRQVFTALSKARREGTLVIFAGDTNLRDSEVNKIGGVPEGIQDVWEAAGKPTAEKFTWDLKLNTNVKMENGSTPRCRFDRAYFAQDVIPGTRVAHLSLLGREVCTRGGRRPSDHFGISWALDMAPCASTTPPTAEEESGGMSVPTADEFPSGGAEEDNERGAEKKRVTPEVEGDVDDERAKRLRALERRGLC
mmetsp:Transcript_74788/g.175563  ORF Transcript_74788/g.175563 Transcript_74788/m.175563 type:complete len:341 (-) Transcript_74788:70-1092(-)